MFLKSLIQPHYPNTAVEISRDRITGVVIEPQKSSCVLKRYFIEPLPAGVLDPSMMRPNIVDFSKMQEILKNGLERLGGNSDRITVLLSDRLAKVSIIALDKVSGSRRELEDLLRWKLKKSTPFRVEAARIGYQVFASDDGRPSGFVLVSLIQDSVLKQYEELLLSQRKHPGLVDFSSFNVYNFYASEIERQVGGNGDSVVLNCADSYFTAMIFRGPRLIFYRCKSWLLEEEGHADVSFCDQLRTELKPSLLYYQERLGGGQIKRVFVRTDPSVSEDLLSLLDTDFPGRVEKIDPSRIVTLQNHGEQPTDEELQLLCPAIGAGVGR
jgi:hypothetical protein